MGRICDTPNFKDFLKDAANELHVQSLTRDKALKLPPWLKTNIPLGKNYFQIEKQLKEKKIATVCQEARCPNIGECWSEKDGNVTTATIMILGDTCTRGCRFCAVKTARKPLPPNSNEPYDVAEAISNWGVGYIVITTVDRDDLIDGGANHLSETVRQVKKRIPEILIECLTSDYQGMDKSIEAVATSGLNVFAHNIETVKRLQRYVRDPRANYNQSLSVLEKAKYFNTSLHTKSSIMLGFGESQEEVIEAMQDLRSINVDFLTIGQYMQPTKLHAKVIEYVNPKIFEFYEKVGLELGFLYIASGPLVRSSYRAGEYYIRSLVK